jgi:RNA polymerase sigma factor (sigma-70 family)
MSMKDSLIFEKLKNGDESVLVKTYKNYRIEFVAWLTKNYDCKSDEALEIYQNSFLAILENMQNNMLTDFTCSFKTYLFSIGKNKYSEYKRYREIFDTNEGFPLMHYEEYTRDDAVSYEHDLKKIRESLKILGEPCRKILEMFYYQQKTLESICESMSYKNEGTVKNQKYRCLLRLKRIFEQQTANIQIYSR